MRITNLIEAEGNPYVTVKQLAKKLDCTERTVRNRMSEMESETERYGQYAIIRDGGLIVINYFAFMDYLRWRKHLQEKNARKMVPPFNASEMAKSIGWYNLKEVV